jgi:exopolysaccharide production protein ExoZ
MIYTTADLFGQPGAARVFLTRRIVRIVPLYWMITAGLILVYLVAPKILNVPIEGWRSIVSRSSSSPICAPTVKSGRSWHSAGR